jgi:hypothetical protein
LVFNKNLNYLNKVTGNTKNNSDFLSSKFLLETTDMVIRAGCQKYIPASMVPIISNLSLSHDE